MSTLRLVRVTSLLTPRLGFIDCSEFGCEIGAVRLNTRCDEPLYLNCIVCRGLLAHDPRRGWQVRMTSREEVARRCEAARERYAPQIGQPWRDLQKMRRKAA